MPDMKLSLQTIFFTLFISTLSIRIKDTEKSKKRENLTRDLDESLSIIQKKIQHKANEFHEKFDHDSESHTLSRLGRPYPITGSWFKDRFQINEWNQTLTQFTAQGGDLVLLRAPPMRQRTKQELASDMEFQWCRNSNSYLGNDSPMCWDEAVSDLKAMGHNVTGFLTYQYEENFSAEIMLCPKYDRKINNSRIYYRIVLPTKKYTAFASPEDSCDIEPGSDVLVLFTSFSGVDPHQLLLQIAPAFNVTVFFGLPAVPYNFEIDLMPAYFAWVKRILAEHKSRFSQMLISKSQSTTKSQNGKTNGNQLVKKSLYDFLFGYFSTDECCLADQQSISNVSTLYQQVGQMVKSYSKLFAISPSINLNKLKRNSTIAQHVHGFTTLAKTGMIDVIAVQEGRGAGKGSYYWPHQRNMPVAEADPILDRILHYLEPQLKVNVTFAETFSASNQELFTAFEQARNQLLPSTKFDFWLNIEAFEYLRDDPCIPVDRAGSGMAQLLDRATKERIDRALSIAGARVQRVVSFAWDSDYICTPKSFNKNLHSEIMSDLGRPIIANCSFHSPHNLSVVVLGFNLEGETQGFKVEWMDTRGRERSSPINGYYFELDYGIANRLVDSLQYVMLWDIPDMVQALAPTGTVNVSAESAYEPCSFKYDLPYSQPNY